VDEAGVRPDEFGKMGQEGDDVMLGDALDLVDRLDIEFCSTALFPDGLCRFPGDDAEVGQRVARIGLDLEPDAESGFGRPDGDHFRPGIARDHRSVLTYREVCPRPNRGEQNAQRCWRANQTPAANNATKPSGK
jgi:hypothetical protein